jgi:hypothetical protein
MIVDQRFLNAVFSEHWQRMDSTETSKRPSARSTSFQIQRNTQSVEAGHLPSSKQVHAQHHNATQSMARNWIDTLGLHDELKECSGGSRTEPAKEKGLVEYWF